MDIDYWIDEFNCEITTLINKLNSEEEKIKYEINKNKEELRKIYNDQIILKLKEKEIENENLKKLLNNEINKNATIRKNYKEKIDEKENLFNKEMRAIHSKYNNLILNIMNDKKNELSNTEEKQNRYIYELKNKINDLKNNIYNSKNFDEKKEFNNEIYETQFKIKEFETVISDFNKKKNEKINGQIKNYLKSFEDNIEELIKTQFSLDENNLVNSFLNSLESTFIHDIKNQIITIIKNKSNIFTQPINHLNIIITGKQNIGKTTLINEILKENENKQINIFDGIFNEYFSKNISLIESLGLNSNFNSKNLVLKIKELINERINSNEQNSFIHSIIFLFSSNRLEDTTIESIKELNNYLPVIFIYKIKNIKSNVNSIKDRLKKKDFNGEFISLNHEINDENINQIIDISKKGVQKSCILFMIEILRKNIKNFFKIIDENINIEKEIKNIELNIDEQEILGNNSIQNFNNLIANIINSYIFKENKDYKIKNNEIFQKIINDFSSNFLKECIIKFKNIFHEIINDKSKDLTEQLIIIQINFIKKNKEYKAYIQKKDELKKDCKKSLIYNFLPHIIKISISHFLKYFTTEIIEKIKKKINDIFEQCLKEKDITDIFESYIKTYFKNE